MDFKSNIQEKYYANYWKKIEDKVSQDSKMLEMFFRMFIVIKTYSHVPQNSVYREFMSWVQQSGLDIKSLFKGVLEYAKIYEYLFNSSLSGKKATLNTALIDFRKINSDLPMSAIMEFCRLYRSDKISEDTLGELIVE